MDKRQFRALVAFNHSKLGQRLAPIVMPVAQQRRYKRQMAKLTTSMWATLKAKLWPVLESLGATGLKKDSRDFFRPFFHTDAGEVGAAIDKVEADFWKHWTRERMGSLVRPVAGEVEKFQATAANNQLRPVVGVDVFGGEPWLDPVVESFVSRNVALIKTIPTRFFDEVETMVTQEASQGQRWEGLKDRIQERFGVAESRAKLIARDQVSKFFGELSRQRHQELGITREIWRGVRDNRERETHLELEGESYDIAKPPEGGPGQPVNCRCYGEPDLSSVLDQVEPEVETKPAEEPAATFTPEQVQTLKAQGFTDISAQSRWAGAFEFRAPGVAESIGVEPGNPRPFKAINSYPQRSFATFEQALAHVTKKIAAKTKG